MKKRSYLFKYFIGFFCAIILILPIYTINNKHEEPLQSQASGTWLDEGNHGTTLEGSGTAESPYLIKSGYDLATFAYNINNFVDNYNNRYYSIVNDIDLSAHYWVTVGTDTNTVNYCIFEGNMHTIKGLTIKNAGVYESLIGRAIGGTYKNMIFETPKINATGPFVAILIGDTSGAKINNVIVRNASITAKDPIYLGGLVGWSSGTFENIYMSGEIVLHSTTTNLSNVGGIVGHYVGAGISYAINEANITAESGDYISALGGIIGVSGQAVGYGTGPVYKCINFGNIYSFSSNGKAGGITPYNCSFDSVYSYAEVYGTTATYGLADNTTGQKACYCLKNNPSNLSDVDATYRKTLEEYKQTNLDPEFFDISETVNNGLPYLKWYYWQGQVDEFVNYHVA